MIAVVGATGTLGPLLIPLLLQRGEPVRVVTRDPVAAIGKVSDAEVVAADATRQDDARRAVAGARVVVSAMSGFATAGVRAVDAEGNRVLAVAAADAGVEQLVLLSVIDAAADHPIPLFRAKAAAEAAVRASGVSWTIVRSSAYLETWLGLVGGPLVANGKTVVFGRGRNPINFVSAADVARVVDLAIGDPTLRGKILEVPGPENLTLEELLETVRVASGRSGRVSHAPRAMLRLLSIALRPIAPIRADQVATALVMDTHDMAIDGAAIRAAYPEIPMTRAAAVAARMFGPAAARMAPAKGHTA